MNPRAILAVGRLVLGRDEVDQITRIAEWRASLTYRPGRGASPSTYAMRAVLWAVQREIENVRKATRAGECSDPCADAHVATEGIETRLDLARLIRRYPLVRARWQGETSEEIGRREGISRRTAEKRACKQLKRAARDVASEKSRLGISR